MKILCKNSCVFENKHLFIFHFPADGVFGGVLRESTALAYHGPLTPQHLVRFVSKALRPYRHVRDRRDLAAMQLQHTVSVAILLYYYCYAYYYWLQLQHTVSGYNIIILLLVCTLLLLYILYYYWYTYWYTYYYWYTCYGIAIHIIIGCNLQLSHTVSGLPSLASEGTTVSANYLGFDGYYILKFFRANILMKI